eukprot:Tamp_15408.p2 GENE.Tamp_15408~~Tamp_15408.p2  ORF type:complete len:116 (-),score=7.75 Tamp_15408:1030-1377(-)
MPGELQTSAAAVPGSGSREAPTDGVARPRSRGEEREQPSTKRRVRKAHALRTNSFAFAAAGAKWLVLCAKRGYRRLPPVAVRGRMACSGFDNTFLASCSRGCPFSTSRSTRLGCQ